MVLVLVLIFFGAGKLPSVFAQAGKGLKAFKDASEGKDTDGAKQAADEEPAPRRRQIARDPDELDDEPVAEAKPTTRKERST